MRLFLSAIALTMLAAAPAKANEYYYISTADVHNFVMQANTAMNDTSAGIGRAFLNRTIADTAVFENRTTFYQNSSNGWQSVWQARPHSMAYYRYPAYTQMTPTSARAMDKWETMNMFQNKKNMIYGYWSDMAVTGIKSGIYGSDAIADLDVREYSLGYDPANANRMTRVMHANSKCKMYLRKNETGIRISRMDCNTNTSFPF